VVDGIGGGIGGGEDGGGWSIRGTVIPDLCGDDGGVESRGGCRPSTNEEFILSYASVVY
jgi:hypothetical protein